jgi:hypothetical protein
LYYSHVNDLRAPSWFRMYLSGYLFISGVAWRRAIREEGFATALFLSDLIERWEIMWDLIKNKYSLNNASMSFLSFHFVWMFVTVHIGVLFGLSVLQSLCICVCVCVCVCSGFLLYIICVHHQIRVIYCDVGRAVTGQEKRIILVHLFL